MEINQEILPKQMEALQALSDFPYVFYGGARGGGKSRLVRMWQIARRLKYPGTSGVIIRKTYPELAINHIEKMLEEYPGLRGLFNKSERCIEFPNRSKLHFRFLQHTEDVYNFQGLEFQDIALDEATQHSELVFKILSASIRTSKVGVKTLSLIHI